MKMLHKINLLLFAKYDFMVIFYFYREASYNEIAFIEDGTFSENRPSKKIQRM